MLEEVNRLTSLVDNLLTISRADSGHIQLHRTVVPVMALAREAAGLFEILMEEKSQRLVLEGDEHAQVEGDCLVSAAGAGQHPPQRREVFAGWGDDLQCAFGTTMPARLSSRSRTRVREFHSRIKPKVFDRFYRVDKARWRESGGTGLGLSIAKWAVEAHGGTLTLESLPNRGCTFEIKLPIAARLPENATGGASIPKGLQPG